MEPRSGPWIAQRASSKIHLHRHTLMQKHTMTLVTCACPPDPGQPGNLGFGGTDRIRVQELERTVGKDVNIGSWFFTKASTAGSQPTLRLSPPIPEMSSSVTSPKAAKSALYGLRTLW